MAFTKPKKKKKKNPYRLSSDRQPGIAKANKGKKKKAPRIMPIPKGDGPIYKNPIGRPTPEQQEQLPKFKDIFPNFKKTKPFAIPALGGLAGTAAKAARKTAKKVAKKVRK